MSVDATSRTEPSAAGPASAEVDEILSLRRRVLPDAAALDPQLAETCRSAGFSAAFRQLIGKKEFRKGYSDIFAGIGYDYPLGRIDYDVADAERDQLIQRTKKEWERLGNEDPHWSVLSSEQFRRDNVPSTTTQFYNSGLKEVGRVLSGLKRQRIVPPFETAVEYGCGLGRVSLALAPHCKTLHALDISEPHLRLAREAAAAKSVHNVVFTSVASPADAVNFEYDFFYSALVFQHNPPPIIVELIRNALSGLRRGGVAVFQVPVYRKGYSFDIRSYLDSQSEGIEMHCVPQRVVFELIEGAGCHLVDCFETSISLRDRLLSNIFTVRRN